MKRFYLIPLVFLLGACSSGSAGSPSSSAAADITGSWESGRFIYEFTSDGDLLYSLNIEGYEDDKEDVGDYSFDGKDLVVTRDDVTTTYTYTTDREEAEKYVNYYWIEGDTLIYGGTTYTKISSAE